jgi:predicted nucleotidyltransferase
MEMLEQAKIAISDLYEKYKDKGILTIYIWGSILTDDFNPETSDIDTIAIVEDIFPLEVEEEMMKYVRDKYPELKEFFIRLLYISELNGGEIKAPLSTVIYPPLLLLEMPRWLYVVGKKFTNHDFKIQPPTFAEAINIRLSRIRKEGWDTVSNIEGAKHMYFIKGVARLIDLLQKNRGLKDLPFSYSKIFKESKDSKNEIEKEAALAIEESKKSNWDYRTFSRNIPIFQKFIDYQYRLIYATKLKEEGFSHVFDWHDEPNTEYPEHSHKGKVSFYVLKGSVTFSGEINITVNSGERFDVPVGVKHSAIVGPDGCDWVVGEEIEGDS